MPTDGGAPAFGIKTPDCPPEYNEALVDELING